jgi:dUTP pyrophosphatase
VPHVIDPVMVQVRRLPHAAELPAYAHAGDAGADLVAAADVELAPGQRAAVPTGIAVAIPDGYVGLVHPRSGLALRHGLTVVNAPGTIDAGYRGEIQVLLVNLDPVEPVRLRRGDRIAQLVVQPVVRAEFAEVSELPQTARGEGGFGSTGGWTHHGGEAGDTAATS